MGWFSDLMGFLPVGNILNWGFNQLTGGDKPRQQYQGALDQSSAYQQWLYNELQRRAKEEQPYRTQRMGELSRAPQNIANFREALAGDQRNTLRDGYSPLTYESEYTQQAPVESNYRHRVPSYPWDTSPPPVDGQYVDEDGGYKDDPNYNTDTDQGYEGSNDYYNPDDDGVKPGGTGGTGDAGGGRGSEINQPLMKMMGGGAPPTSNVVGTPGAGVYDNPVGFNAQTSTPTTYASQTQATPQTMKQTTSYPMLRSMRDIGELQNRVEGFQQDPQRLARQSMNSQLLSKLLQNRSNRLGV